MRILAFNFGPAEELTRSLRNVASDAQRGAEATAGAVTDPDAWSTAGHVALALCIFAGAIVFLLCALVFFRRK